MTLEGSLDFLYDFETFGGPKMITQGDNDQFFMQFENFVPHKIRLLQLALVHKQDTVLSLEAMPRKKGMIRG